MQTSGTPQQCYYTCKLIWEITYSDCCHLPASLETWKISVDWIERQINSFGVLWGDPLLLKDKHQSGEWLRDGNSDGHRLPGLCRTFQEILSTSKTRNRRQQLKNINFSLPDEKTFNLNMYVCMYVYINIFFVKSLLLIYLLCLFLHYVYIYWMQKPKQIILLI